MGSRRRQNMANQEPEEPEGRPIHFGNLVFFVLLVLSALLILVFWGWRRLWWLLPLGGGVWLFFFIVIFIVSLWEDRWRIVTPKDKAWGAPERCPRCNHEVDIARRGQRYTIRCPSCGHKQKGTLEESGFGQEAPSFKPIPIEGDTVPVKPRAAFTKAAPPPANKGYIPLQPDVQGSEEPDDERRPRR